MTDVVVLAVLSSQSLRNCLFGLPAADGLGFVRLDMPVSDFWLLIGQYMEM